jgi:hypothetical protein
MALLTKENLSNKVGSAGPPLSASSTDDQYPSALAVYNFVTLKADEAYQQAVADLTPPGAYGELLTGSNVVPNDETAQNPRTQDYAKYDYYAVPPYVVGAKQLEIYHNGLRDTLGREFKEVGAAGSTSTQIQLLHDLITRDSYDVYVKPHM